MSYLVQKHRTFWFQLHVPKQLVPHYGKYIRQCLQTTERSVAQPLALQLAGQWLARFSTEKMSIEDRFASPVVTAPQPFIPHVAPQPAAYVPPPLPVQSYGNPAGAFFAEPEHKPTPTPKKQAEPAKSLDDLLAYWKRLRPDASASSYREFLSVVKDFKKIIRKRPENLVRLDIAAYRDKLIVSGLARATVSKKISFISTLLQTAYDGGLLPQNVARGLRIPKPKIPEITRRAFTAQELKRIFTSSVYTKKNRPRACGGEAIVWVPLIALATGARLEEICQLRVADVLDGEHGPLLRITDEGEGQYEAQIEVDELVMRHKQWIDKNAYITVLCFIRLTFSKGQECGLR